MKRFLAAVAAASLISLGAAAQIEGQATGSSSSGANVQAGQTNANVNSSTSSDANAQAGRRGRQATANGSGSASNDSSASVNGKSANASSAEAGSLASGTTIPAKLMHPVDARKAKAGDEVAAKTTQDVRSDSGVVIPRGSRLVGHVTDAKAKAKGDSESALGIAFDHAVLRNGQEVPLNASIKALAAATNASSASLGDDNLGTAGSSSLGAAAAPAGGGRGGLLGGTGSAVGGATSAVGSTAGGVTNGVGNTAGSLSANAGGTATGATRGATGQLTSQSEGVVGLNGLSLNSTASNVTQGSVITSAGKDVKLDSGTQILLQVNQQ
jgi:hypothetical protein